MTSIATEVSDPLANLARTWSDRDNGERTHTLFSLVPGSWAGVPPVALMDAWADFMDALLRLDDLCAGCGEGDWRDYSDTCATESDVHLMVGGWVDEARKKLMNGPRRGAS
jgi:hypothetical protein